MNTGKTGLPDFTEAESLFEDFVCRNGGNGELTWVFREDLNLAADKHKILILQPDKVQNRELVREAYEESKKKAFGILLDVLCPIAGGGCCTYIFIPKDRDEAEYKMVHGLKFGALGFGIRRTGRVSRRPRVLGNLMRRFGQERSDPWLLDVPTRQVWK